MPGLKGICIAGTHSGSGKTTLSLGLMAALRRRGLAVQAFKVGPDFIDPGHHQALTSRPSHTLDSWMCGPDAVRDIFARHAIDADIAVVEGVMGLFDGASGASEDGSTAQVAKWLGLPLLLVLDARSMARSIAALASGFLGFDPELRFAGLVCNRVGSPNHQALLAEALAGPLPGVTRVPPVFFLPRDASLSLPSRHLGLVTAGDLAWDAARVSALADWVESGIDVPALVAALPDIVAAPPAASPAPVFRARLGVARDAAFCFYYQENLRLLEEAGAELAFFSPLADRALPAGVQGLYFGGGYPELHAETLANNTAMRQAVRAFAARGGVVYAECGGFMYLMRSLTDAAGRDYPMAGVFAHASAMAGRFQALGYREARFSRDCLLGPAGTAARGHEFRYSRLVAGDPEASPVYALRDRAGERPEPEGFAKGNVLGSYVHLHFASAPGLARSLVEAASRVTPEPRRENENL